VLTHLTFTERRSHQEKIEQEVKETSTDEQSTIKSGAD